MPTHAPHRPSNFTRWLFVTCLGACVGTPTPEPPDNLPPLKDTLIFGAPVEIDLASTPTHAVPVPVRGKAGAGQPNGELWIVNLDSTEDAVSVVAGDDGGFETSILGLPNDRVLLFARTDLRHSLPIEGQVASVGPGRFILTQAPPTALSCLDIEPAQEISAVVTTEVTRHFTLTSRCDELVRIDRARLRFGEQSFVLDAPTSLDPHGTAELKVRFRGHDGAQAKADIVLLDVSSGSQSGRYALGIWSVSAASMGSDR